MFCLELFLFCSVSTNSNQSTIQMASSRVLGEPLQCICFLSNVSFDIEYICFKTFVIFELFEINFFPSFVNSQLILSKYRLIFFSHKLQINHSGGLKTTNARFWRGFLILARQILSTLSLFSVKTG